MDIAPELLEKVSGALRKALIADSVTKTLLAKNEAGKATYLDAEAYSARVGELLAEAVTAQIIGSTLPDGRMYYNIAEKVLGPSLRSNHDNVTAYCKPVQERMNREAGLNIKYVKPEFDEDRARGIYAYASRHDDFDSIKSSLGSTLVNFTQHSVDESIKENAEFQAKAGYKAKIVRTAEAGCCEWCADLAGEYEYPDGVSSDTFARHDNCRCTMEYIIGDRAQDVWTKRWREAENEEKVKSREAFAEKVANKESHDTIYRENKQLLSHARFKTGELSPEQYALAKDLWRKYKEQEIPYDRGKEALFEEFDNNLSGEEKESCIIHKAVDGYKYTAIHLGHNEYKVIRVDPIERDPLEAEMRKLFGDEYDNYFNW